MFLFSFSRIQEKKKKKMTEAEMKSTLHRQKIIHLKIKETQGKGESYLVL